MNTQTKPGLPTFVVFEGPDGLGITTTSKALAALLRATYLHLTATPKLIEAMSDYEWNQLENISDNLMLGNNVVVDRLLDSEYVYAQALRNAEPDDAVNPDLFDEMFSMNPIVVFVMRDDVDDAVQLHDANTDPAHPYNKDEYRKVYAGYEERLAEYPDCAKAIRFVVDFDKDPQHEAKRLLRLILKSPI